MSVQACVVVVCSVRGRDDGAEPLLEPLSSHEERSDLVTRGSAVYGISAVGKKPLCLPSLPLLCPCLSSEPCADYVTKE